MPLCKIMSHTPVSRMQASAYAGVYVLSCCLCTWWWQRILPWNTAASAASITTSLCFETEKHGGTTFPSDFCSWMFHHLLYSARASDGQRVACAMNDNRTNSTWLYRYYRLCITSTCALFLHDLQPQLIDWHVGFKVPNNHMIMRNAWFAASTEQLKISIDEGEVQLYTTQAQLYNK